MSFSDVEESVAEAIFEAHPRWIDPDIARVLARAAIRRIRELRLTAVLPDE